MRLSELTPGYHGDFDPDIKGLTQDSRAVREGWLFAALPGARADGTRFMVDAVRHGAVAILAPLGARLEETGERVAFLTDETPRRRLARIAAAFYGRQPETIAAVTGTNGKTSTAHFTWQLWSAMGYKAASLGTLGMRGPESARPGSLTTPDPVTLHADLADLAAAGVAHLVMEASSHGLHQSRLDGVRVRVAAFTNLSHDHLDYHETMEAYLAAKSHLFSEILIPNGVAVLNADAPEYTDLADLVEKRGGRVVSYGAAGRDIALKDLTPVPGGQRLALEVFGTAYGVDLPLVGAFQTMNALCALGIVLGEGYYTDPATVIPLLARLKGAPGRLESVPGARHGGVYIDYAHTPDALENVLKALRPHTAGRLVCIIGCGGDRDAAKRPLMGKIAADLADTVFITDDNPRSEDPARIRRALLDGAGSRAQDIPDRRDAIRQAVTGLKDGDVLVIAGKGHETGQIVGDKVLPFDDAEEARTWF